MPTLLAATSDEDDATDAALLVPMFTDVLHSIDNIRRFVCAVSTVGDLAVVPELERQLLLHRSKKIYKEFADFMSVNEKKNILACLQAWIVVHSMLNLSNKELFAPAMQYSFLVYFFSGFS